MTTRNVLIYSHVPLWTDHHAETLELACRHVEAGDHVYILSCEGALASCPANASHDATACRMCRRQTNHSLSILAKKNVSRLTLSLPRIHLTIPQFRSIPELVTLVVDGVPLGALVASQLVDDHRDCYLDLAALRDRVTTLVANGLALYRESTDIIRKHRIDKVYVWNGRRCSDGPVAYAAINLGIPVESHIWGGNDHSLQTLAAPMVHDLPANHRAIIETYDAYVRQRGPEAAHAIADACYSELRYGKARYPGFVSFAERFDRSAVPARDGRKRIVIFPSSAWEYYALPGYAGGCYPSHYEGLRALLAEKSISGDCECIVRWHPNLTSCGPGEREVVDRIIVETGSQATHYAPESPIDSYALLETADVVVTFGSTIGIESTYYGRPSVMLGRCLYQGLGSCYEPATHEEAVALIRQPLKPLPRLGALQYGLYIKCRGNLAFEHLHREADKGWRLGDTPILPPPMRRGEKIIHSLHKARVRALRRLRQASRFSAFAKRA